MNRIDYTRSLLCAMCDTKAERVAVIEAMLCSEIVPVRHCADRFDLMVLAKEFGV